MVYNTLWPSAVSKRVVHYNAKSQWQGKPNEAFIEGENRFQSTLFPESLEDYIADDNPVRVIDAFVNGLDLKQLGFDRADRVRPADRAMNRQSC